MSFYIDKQNISWKATEEQGPTLAPEIKMVKLEECSQGPPVMCAEKENEKVSTLRKKKIL